MKRTAAFALVVAALAGPAPLRAQLTAAPDMRPGTELSLVATQPAAFSTSTSGAGIGGTLRHAGRVHVALRAFYVDHPAEGLSGEITTFGSIGTGGSALRVGWFAGVGYDTAPEGSYVPIGLTASRAFRVGGTSLAPFAQVRVALREIDVSERAAGTLGATAEGGVDLGISGSLSARLGVFSSENGAASGIGLAWRP